MTYASCWYILQQIGFLTPTEANVTCNVRGFVLAVVPYLMAISFELWPFDKQFKYNNRLIQSFKERYLHQIYMVFPGHDICMIFKMMT